MQLTLNFILCDVFDCQPLGFGEIVNADYIRNYPFVAMASGLAYIYATANDSKRAEITKFINDFRFFSGMSFDELLSFDSSEKVIDNGKITIGIGYENGKKVVEDMIEKFRNICKSK